MSDVRERGPQGAEKKARPSAHQREGGPKKKRVHSNGQPPEKHKVTKERLKKKTDAQLQHKKFTTDKKKPANSRGQGVNAVVEGTERRVYGRNID